MKSVIHKANQRGYNDLGWLKANHSFSFAHFYDENKIHFGALRVLNDDIIAPGMGFGTHPHDNMEIVTIPLKGQLQHRDSMGSNSVIHAGEVQMMSAGSGIQHSEFNASKTDEINLLQIWVFPEHKNIDPVYNEKDFTPFFKDNAFTLLISPNGEAESLPVNQQTWFSKGNFSADHQQTYTLHTREHGVYVFVIEGAIKMNDTTLTRRDAMGIWETDAVSFTALENSNVLLIEVPMVF
jgi:redox-sensitive bicupin YhaK (pirin superfamily)